MVDDIVARVDTGQIDWLKVTALKELIKERSEAYIKEVWRLFLKKRNLGNEKFRDRKFLLEVEKLKLQGPILIKLKDLEKNKEK